MAQRYNVLPSDLMNLSPFDFGFNLRVWKVGMEKDFQDERKKQSEMKQAKIKGRK